MNSVLKHYFVQYVNNNSYSAENRKLQQTGTAVGR